jgi:glycolate oxidase FAD binding subunit
LIGVTVALADGRVVHSGGKVVKNVAGYDLGKLLIGSLGTLGVLGELIFRVHPLPAAVRVVHIPAGDAAAACRVSGRILGSDLVPSALELATTHDGEHLALVALFEGVEASVEHQATQLSALCGGGTISDRLPHGFGRRPYGGGDLGVRIAHPIADLAVVLETLQAVDASFGLQLRVSCQVGVGITAAGFPVPAEPEHAVAALGELRGKLAGLDASVVVVQAPPAIKRTLDVWGPVRGLDLMRRVKSEFDPDHRLAPGRFVGGI